MRAASWQFPVTSFQLPVGSLKRFTKVFAGLSGFTRGHEIRSMPIFKETLLSSCARVQRDAVIALATDDRSEDRQAGVAGN